MEEQQSLEYDSLRSDSSWELIVFLHMKFMPRQINVSLYFHTSVKADKI